MASTKAHHNTGIAAGVMAAVIVLNSGAGGPYLLWCVLAFLMGCSGGTAPDWMEVAWWSRRHRLWITHRTWTHWGVAWIGLFVYALISLKHHMWAPALLGFTAGGLMHLLADWPNPVGVPWIYGRHSLKLWKSGKCDYLVIAFAWTAVIVVTDHLCFKDTHLQWLYRTAKAWVASF